MDFQRQYDHQRHNKQKPSNKIDEDEEQIEKTMNFFDSILDPYLNDQESNDEIKGKHCSPTTNLSSTKTAHQLNVNISGHHKQELDVSSISISEKFNEILLYTFFFVDSDK